MGCYLSALKKHGYKINYDKNQDKIQFSKNMPDSYKKIIRANRLAIIAEILELEPKSADPTPCRQYDPRPDLWEDHWLWEDLLRKAGDTKTAWLLHGIRCDGARIEKDAVRSFYMKQGEACGRMWKLFKRAVMWKQNDNVGRTRNEYIRLMRELSYE